MKSLYASDIQDNQSVDSLFLVSAKNHGVTKGGNGYLVLKLLDRSGVIEGRVWERADDLGEGSTKMTSFESGDKRFCIKEKYKFGFKMS